MQLGKIHQTFTGRLFRSFLSLALMLMGITGIAVSLISMYVLKTNVIKDNQQLLTQFGNSVDTTFDYVDHMMSHFIADQKTRDFLNYYNQKDIEVINTVSAQFRNFMISNDYIHSIAIYYPGDGLVYVANWGVIPVEDYYDCNFLTNLDLSNIFSVWKTPRTVQDHTGHNTQLFSITKPLKYNGNNLSAVLIVNLSTSFFTQVFSSNSLTNHAYLAMNDNAVVVAYSQNAEDYLPDSDQIFMALSSTGHREITLNREKLLLSCIDSPDSSWKYYGFIKTNILYKEIMTLLILSAAIFITGSVIAVFFSRFYSKKLSAPIETIASQFQKPGQAGQTDYEEKDILKHIEHGIAMLKTENQSIQQSLEESLPILRNNFLISLLSGFVTDFHETDRNLTYFGIAVTRDCPVCATIIKINEFDAQTGEKYLPLQLHSFTTYLMDLLEATFSDGQNYLLCNSYEDEITLISALPSYANLEANSDQKEEVMHSARLIEQLFENEKKHFSSISIGSAESTIHNVRLSYANAKKALALDFLSSELLINYEDIAMLSPALMEYPYQLEENLMIALRSNSMDAADNCLKEILNNILLTTHGAKKVRTYFLMQLYGAILKYANESNILEFCLNESNNYTEILSLTRENVSSWFHGLIENIVTRTLYKKANPEQFISERIKEYLRENYGNDMSVTDLSSVFLYSPAHMSRLFHNETGYSIKQYLTKIRMDKACELLQDYSLKIAEVSELTGYPKVHGFLKQFKNHTGMTPSEYREVLSQKK